MDYISTRGMSPAVDSAQAVLNGLAPDGGLYVPKSIPAFDWQECLQKSSQGMSEMILSALLRQDYDPSAVLEIVRRTLY